MNNSSSMEFTLTFFKQQYIIRFQILALILQEGMKMITILGTLEQCFDT